MTNIEIMIQAFMAPDITVFECEAVAMYDKIACGERANYFVIDGYS